MERFWVTTKPTADSTREDCVFQTDAAGFVRQVRGGLSETDEPRIFNTELEALADFSTRCSLLAQRFAALRDRADEAGMEAAAEADLDCPEEE